MKRTSVHIQPRVAPQPLPRRVRVTPIGIVVALAAFFIVVNVAQMVLALPAPYGGAILALVTLGVGLIARALTVAPGRTVHLSLLARLGVTVGLVAGIVLLTTIVLRLTGYATTLHQALLVPFGAVLGIIGLVVAAWVAVETWR